VLKNVFITNMYVEVPKAKPDAGYPMEGPELKYPSDRKADTSVKYQSISPWNNSGVDSSAVPYPHNVFPSSVTGIPGHSVENVHIENIKIVYEGGAEKNKNYMPLDSLQNITEAESNYPEFSMFGELPVWGFYARHVKGLTVKNCTIISKNSDYRCALLVNDIDKLELNNINIPKTYANPAIVLNKVINQKINQIVVPDKTKAIHVQNK